MASVLYVWGVVHREAGPPGSGIAPPLFRTLRQMLPQYLVDPGLPYRPGGPEALDHLGIGPEAHEALRSIQRRPACLRTRR